MTALTPQEPVLNLHVMSGAMTLEDLQAAAEQGIPVAQFQGKARGIAPSLNGTQAPQQEDVAFQPPPEESVPSPAQSPTQPQESTGGQKSPQVGGV
jgi:hypothetical protein